MSFVGLSDSGWCISAMFSLAACASSLEWNERGKRILLWSLNEGNDRYKTKRTDRWSNTHRAAVEVQHFIFNVMTRFLSLKQMKFVLNQLKQVINLMRRRVQFR